MLVGHEAARGFLGHQRQTRGLDEALQLRAPVPVRRGRAGDDQRSLGCAQQADRFVEHLRACHARRLRPVRGGREEAHVRFLDALRLHIDGHGEVHRPASPLERGAQRGGHQVRDAPRIVHQPGALGRRLRQAHLVDLLHDAAVVMAQVCRAGDVEHRALGGEGVDQPGQGVGVPRRGEGAHARPPGHARPCVGHVHRGLLVAAVDQPEALVGQQVEQGQDVVAREREHGVHALQAQRAGQQLRPGRAHARPGNTFRSFSRAARSAPCVVAQSRQASVIETP